MKRFSAQYIITNLTKPLKRAVITTEDDGTVISVEDMEGDLREIHSLEFYNGIIIPGFVNCHCHLELSHMKGTITPGGGLGKFLNKVSSERQDNNENIISSALSADDDMYRSGTVLCADICNTSITFNIKKDSSIAYINLLEVFGVDPEKAKMRMDEIIKLATTAREMNIPHYLVPHTAYTMSLPLFRLLKDKSDLNRITSIHFMETKGEVDFLKNHSGPLFESFKKSGLLPSRLETVKDHTEAILKELTLSGNLILVHNTFVDKKSLDSIKERANLFWCLCPNSNVFIENKMPPLSLLLQEECEIVIGTDSLASNTSLDILEELKTLQLNFPSVSINELVRWATLNGARALGEEKRYGTIKEGTKPGLLLLQNVDLLNMKLQPDSYITRLI